jgi:predicted transposase YdaD
MKPVELLLESAKIIRAGDRPPEISNKIMALLFMASNKLVDKERLNAMWEEFDMTKLKIIEIAEERGEARGEARAEARLEARVEALAEARNKARLAEIAQSLLQAGVSVDLIKRTTGVDVAALEAETQKQA